MRPLRTLAGVGGLVAAGQMVLTGMQRHEVLVDYLDQLVRNVGELRRPDVDACDTPVKPIVPNVSMPEPAPAAVLYGPSTGKVSVVRADGSGTIHASHGAKWDQVSAVARTVGVDVDELEKRMLARHKGCRQIRDLPAKEVNRATTKLLDHLTTSREAGGAL